MCKSHFILLLLSIFALCLGLHNKCVQAKADDSSDPLGSDVTGETNTHDVKIESKDNADTSSEKQNSAKELNYISPKLKDSENIYLYENFDDPTRFESNWIQSSDNKYEGKWRLNSGADRPHADQQLLLPTKARHYAISSKLVRPFKFSQAKPLIVQYEVQFREGLDCGGAYIKLLRDSAINDLSKLTDKTPYTIMFGPDRCGGDAKLHFIIQYQSPRNQEYGEKHWKQAKLVTDLMPVFNDKKHHLFKLALEPDNKFEIFLDGKSVGKGSLLEDLDPAINPPKEIVDPNDKKPDDWDERPQIDDLTATKPDDWDENAPMTIEDLSAVKPSDWLENEPKYIPDPEATKPDDWEEMDGEWEAPKIENPACAKASGCGEWKAPMIPNPNYKGKWKRPKVDNPDYKGKWTPRNIPNPDYFNDENPFASLDNIGGVAFELWSMSDNIAFDNLIVTSDHESASLLQHLTWQEKKAEADASSDSVVTRVTHYLKVYPWLWAVLVLAVALPLVLFISYCCDTKRRGATPDEAGRRKKTDEPKMTDDDEEDLLAEGNEDDAEMDDEDEAEENNNDDGDASEEEEPIATKTPKRSVRQRKKN